MVSWCMAVMAASGVSVGEPLSGDGGRSGPYQDRWESLKEHPVPEWFDEEKFGVFIHWGPYSVLGYRKGGRGYAEHVPKELYRDPAHYYPWMKQRFGAAPPEFGYKDVVPLFTAEHWDPDAWATLFRMAGARYVVLTAEHHDGYALWDSALTPWCATKVGPMRDLVGDLGVAVRKQGMKYAPSYHRERHPGFFAQPEFALASEPHADIAEEIRRMPEAARLYGPFDYGDAFIDDYVARWQEIQEKYHPDFMWLDHIPVFHKYWCKDAGDPQIEAYRRACRRMITGYLNHAAERGQQVYLNNKGPERGFNWPSGVGCREKDNYRPDKIGTKWQNPATLATSYGYMEAEERADAYKSPTELVHLLCDVVSKNGNLLLNIGPRADGTIPEGMQQRLLAIGAWLEANGEAIYGTKPWPAGAGQAQPDIRFTTKGDDLFAILLEPVAEPFVIGMDAAAGAAVREVTLLAGGHALGWERVDEGLRVTPPVEWPGEHAWAVRVRLAGEPQTGRRLGPAGRSDGLLD